VQAFIGNVTAARDLTGNKQGNLSKIRIFVQAYKKRVIHAIQSTIWGIQNCKLEEAFQFIVNIECESQRTYMSQANTGKDINVSTVTNIMEGNICIIQRQKICETTNQAPRQDYRRQG
jgi:hypothetical protein